MRHRSYVTTALWMSRLHSFCSGGTETVHVWNFGWLANFSCFFHNVLLCDTECRVLVCDCVRQSQMSLLLPDINSVEVCLFWANTAMCRSEHQSKHLQVSVSAFCGHKSPFSSSLGLFEGVATIGMYQCCTCCVPWLYRADFSCSCCLHFFTFIVLDSLEVLLFPTNSVCA